MTYGQLMNEFEPTSEEDRDFVAPRTGEIESTEQTVEPTGFTESAEMIEIRTRVEQGEELTQDLYIAYQVAGEQLADTIIEGDPALARLELQFSCAQLMATAGMKELAAENLVDLTMTPEMDQYPEFGAKVSAALKEHGL